MDRTADDQVKGAPAGRRRAPRVAFVATAALAVVAAALECSPSRWGASADATQAPPITAEPLPRFERGPKAHPRWSWPGAAHFDGIVAGVRRDAVSVRLVRGRLVKDVGGERKEVDGVVLTVAPDGDTFQVGVELAERPDAYEAARFWPRSGWALATGPLDEAAAGAPLVFQREGATIRIEPTYVSPAGRPAVEALDDWAYVAALLGSDPPVYSDPPAAPPEVNHEEEIKAAGAAGDDARALALYRSWRPVGRCSMDTRPAEVARDYAELCYRLGNLGCFLQLQVRIMGDQFDRVAYSSYGEAAHATQAERLVETGLDVDRFLLGLVLRFAGVSRLGELDPWRLARSIQESGQEDLVLPVLVDWASDPRFDELNRLRAVQMIALLDAEEDLDEDELPDIARLWLDQHRDGKR